MAAWKNHEKRTATALGGKRNSRGDNFGQSLPDVDHNLFSIECKLRKKLPVLLQQGLEQAEQYDANKISLLVLKERYARESLIVLKMKDFRNLFSSLDQYNEVE
jgi:hypothetical protein